MSRSYSSIVKRIEDYPEAILLPVEVLDGAIGHSKIVGFLSYAIADSMSITNKEKEDILLAGYLCDIGKEIIPQHILNRKSGLTNSEFEEVTICTKS